MCTQDEEFWEKSDESVCMVRMMSYSIYPVE